MWLINFNLFNNVIIIFIKLQSWRRGGRSNISSSSYLMGGRARGSGGEGGKDGDESRGEETRRRRRE